MERLEKIKNTLSITDSRTGKTHEVPIQYKGREPFVLSTDL